MGIGIGVIAILIGVIKFLNYRNTTLRNEVNIAKKSLKFREDVDIVESEIDQEFSHRAEEARKDLDEGDIPDHLQHPRD